MDPFVGEIRLFPWDWAPRGWALCNGATLGVSQNQALFALLGTVYGGNGSTTFQLPDLRGRTAIDRSATDPQGLPDGTESVTLNIGTIPAHAHQMMGTSTVATVKAATNNLFANDTAPVADFYAADTNPLLAISPLTVSTAGSNQPHPNMQPYTVLNYCIALFGLFPSRN